MNNNSQTKRAFWHNYRMPGRYMVTLSKSPEVPPLSSIEGDWMLPIGTPGSAYTRWSPIGRKIADIIYRIGDIHPSLKAEQYVVMPDHVHILLLVQKELPEPLGFFIARFKKAVNLAAETSHIFEDGFNDQIVSPKRNLNALFEYIRSNPYRLAVRRARPDFFTTHDKLIIEGNTYQSYGNIQLLSNPFKDQVIVHRADTPEQFGQYKERWLYTIVNGGVIVSPFISKAEKTIRSEAETLGARIILITHEAFPERYKPHAHDFDLCSQGRLLIISLGLPAKTPLTREVCLRMNSLAAAVACPGFSHNSAPNNTFR